MKNENEFSKMFRDKLREIFGTKYHITSVEEVGNGMPDLLIAHRCHGPVLVELKVIKNKSSVIPFRKAQPQWISSFVASGGQVTVIVYIQETKEVAVLFAQSIRKLVAVKFAEIPEECFVEYLQKKDEMSKWFIAHLVIFKSIYRWGP